MTAGREGVSRPRCSAADPVGAEREHGAGAVDPELMAALRSLPPLVLDEPGPEGLPTVPERFLLPLRERSCDARDCVRPAVAASRSGAAYCRPHGLVLERLCRRRLDWLPTCQRPGCAAAAVVAVTLTQPGRPAATFKLCAQCRNKAARFRGLLREVRLGETR